MESLRASFRHFFARSLLADFFDPAPTGRWVARHSLDVPFALSNATTLQVFIVNGAINGVAGYVSSNFAARRRESRS